MATPEGSSDGYPSNRRGPTPMKIAFALREADGGVPFAEAVVEVDERSHPVLLDQAHESGFVLATGEQPPPTSAEVHVRGSRFTNLTMLGERQVWEMDPPAPVAGAWTDAAAHHGAAIVSIVAPGTWPADIADIPADDLAAWFARSLAEARETGRMLHGTARVVHEAP